jgi:hypothetical protein
MDLDFDPIGVTTSSWVDRGTFQRDLQFLSSYTMDSEAASSFGTLIPRPVYQTAHLENRANNLKKGQRTVQRMERSDGAKYHQNIVL